MIQEGTGFVVVLTPFSVLYLYLFQKSSFICHNGEEEVTEEILKEYSAEEKQYDTVLKQLNARHIEDVPWHKDLFFLNVNT